jgi:outer membrane protein TolC
MLALVLVASHAEAQVSLVVSAPPGMQATPYSQYVDRVLAESPLFVEAQASSAAANAAIDVARVYPSPYVTGGLMQVDVSGHNAPTQTWVELHVPIDYSGVTGRRVDSRLAAYQSAQASVDTVRRDLSRVAIGAYVDALEAILARVRASEAADADAALATAIEARVTAGEGTALQAALARLAAANSVARRVEAEGRARTTLAALSSYLGAYDDTLAPIGDLGIVPRTFDASGLVEEALENRPEIRAARMAATTAERERDLASASRWPAASLTVGWFHSFSDLLPSLFNQPEYDALMLGLTVEIPLRLAWDGDLRTADAGIAQSNAQLRASELAVSIEVRTALAAYETARDRWVARQAALEEATRLRAAAAQALASGSGTIVELLAAQAAARDAEAAYLAAAADHARTLAILLSRVGREVDVF